MKTIRIMFLCADRSDPLLNRLVSWIDPPYCHVEIEFDDSNTGPCLASSIYAQETVFFRRRTFANPLYNILTLHVEDPDYRKIYSFCEKASKEMVEFDNVGMHMSLVRSVIPDYALSFLCPCAWFTETKKSTFCSKHVCEALQAGNVKDLKGVDSRTMRPSLLYKILSRSQNQCFSSVPYKVNLLQTHAVQW